MTRSAAVVDIHRAGPADVDALARVGAESFQAAYQATTTPDDIALHIDAHFSPDAIRDAMQTTPCQYFLASVNAEPAGLLKLRSNDVPDSVPNPNAIEIQLLYILPAMQRFGLGGRLVEVAKQMAAEQGAAGIWLSAWQDADWALGFYSKTGFQAVGTQAFKVGETRYTDLIMWLPLD